MIKAKETRPGTAATVQDAQVHNGHINDTPSGASRQAPEIAEFLETSVWCFVFEIELHVDKVKKLRNAFRVIAEGLDPSNPNADNEEYGSVADIAWNFADKLLKDMEKTITEIQTHERCRRAICEEMKV